MSIEKYLTKGTLLLITNILTISLIVFIKEPVFGLLIFFAFALGILLIFNQLWGICALLLLRPILDLSSNASIIELGDLSLNFASVISLSVVISFLITFSLQFKKIKSMPLFKQWLIFGIVSILSLAFTINFSLSIGEILRIMTIFAVFCFSYLAATDNDLKTIIKAIVISSIIPVSVSLFQFFTKTGFSLSFEDVPNRVFGTFAHPNPFAYFTALAFSLCLVFVLEKQNKQRFFAAAYSIIATIAIGLTYTRGAWLLVAGVVFLAGVIKFRKLLALSAFSIFIAYLLVSPFQTRINSLFHQGPSSSILWRISLWSDSLSYIAEKPILGHGIGTSTQLILEKRGDSFGATESHNDFLRSALDAGILGLLAYLYLLISMIVLLVKKYQKTPQPFEKLTLLFLFSFAIMLFFSSAIDNIFEASALQLAFWASIGAALAKRKHRVISAKNKPLNV